MFTVVRVSNPVFFVNKFGERIQLKPGMTLADNALLSSPDGEEVVLKGDSGSPVSVMVQDPQPLINLVSDGGSHLTKDDINSRENRSGDVQTAPLHQEVTSDKPSNTDHKTSLDTRHEGAHHHSTAVVERTNLEVNLEEEGDNVGNGLISNSNAFSGVNFDIVSSVESDASLNGQVESSILQTNHAVSSSSGGSSADYLSVITAPSGTTSTASGGTLTATEDSPLALSARVFGFTSAGTGSSLGHVTIVSLPAPNEGQLLLKGHSVTENQQITPADVDHLVFKPAPNFHGNVHFSYTVNDGHADSSAAQVTIAVSDVNDAPTITSQNLVANEDSAHAFTGAEFGFTDVDGDRMDHVTITQLPDATEGVLLLDGAAVKAEDDIDAAKLDHLTFRPVHDFHGDVTFKYTVNDGRADSVEATGTLKIVNTVDMPTISVGDATGTEDQGIALTIGGTAQSGDTISQYVISGVPSGASLSAGHNDGGGQWTVPVAAIGNLKITPPANFSGDMQLHAIATATDGTHTADSTSHALTVHVNPDPDVPNIDSFDVNGSSSIGTPAGPTSLTQVITVTHDMEAALSKTFSASYNTSEDSRVFLHLEHATFADIKSMTIDGKPVPDFLFNVLAKFPHDFHIQKVGSIYNIFPLFGLAEGKQIEIEFNAGTDPSASLEVKSHEDSAGGFSAYIRNEFTSHTEAGATLLSGLARPGVTPQTVALHEDGGVDLHFAISSPDSSETLELSISGLPNGAKLNHGTQQTDGSWLVDEGDLATLKATLPDNYQGGIDLEVKAISHDGTQTAESAVITRHIDVASVTDQATLTTGDLTVDEHHADWQALPITTGETDTQDPISGIVIKNLTADFELRLEPGAKGNAPVHNADGTWTIDPQTAEHLQVRTADHDGQSSVYQVEVTTTGPDGVDAMITHSGHVVVNAVIDNQVELEAGLTSTTSGSGYSQTENVDLSGHSQLQTVGDLFNFHETDTDEKTMLYVRVPDNVRIYRSNGTTYSYTDDMQDDGHGHMVDRDPGYHTYWVPASEMGKTTIMGASAAQTGVDIQVEVRHTEGTGSTKASESEHYHFTGAAVAEHNWIPQARVQNIAATEDQPHTFSAADFHFVDGDAGDQLDHVTITSLPDATQGTLTLNGVAVIQGQGIDAGDISKLVFTPEQHFNGDVHFGYTVSDGKNDSAPVQATVRVEHSVSHDETMPDPSAIEDDSIDLAAQNMDEQQLNLGALRNHNQQSIDSHQDSVINEHSARAAAVLGGAIANEANDALERMVEHHLHAHRENKAQTQTSATGQEDNGQTKGADEKAAQSSATDTVHTSHDDTTGGSAHSHLDSLVSQPGDDSLPPI